MMELYLSVLVGSFIYLLFSLNEIYGQPEFAWNIFFKQNWLSTITNLVCGCFLVWQRDEIAQWLPMTSLVAGFMGVAGQTVLKRIFKMFDKKIDTFVGINS